MSTPDTTPPTPSLVAARALAQVGLLFRGNIERDLLIATRPRGIVERLNVLVREWLDREKLLEHLTDKDRELLGNAPGTWDEKLIADTSWRIEGVGMYLWSLGLVPSLASFDGLFDLDEVLPTLEVFSSTQALFGRVTLRDAAVLDAAFTVAELWDWRAKVDQLQRRANLPPSPQSLNTALQKLREAQQVALGVGREHMGVGTDDFFACGRAYRDASAEERSTCATLARERLKAMEWVCARSPGLSL